MTDIVCAAHGYASSSRDRKRRDATDVYNRNMRKVNEACKTQYQNCKYYKCDERFLECVRKASEECLRRQTAEEELYQRMQRDIDSSYPVNEDIRALYESLP